MNAKSPIEFSGTGRGQFGQGRGLHQKTQAVSAMFAVHQGVVLDRVLWPVPRVRELGVVDRLTIGPERDRA